MLHAVFYISIVILRLDIVGEDVAQRNLALAWAALAGGLQIGQELVVLLQVVAAQCHVGIAFVEVIIDNAEEALEE